MKRLALLAASTLPFFAYAGPDTPPPVKTYILDGIWGFPQRWEGLRRRIERDVGPCDIWHYNSSGLVSLEKLGQQLVTELQKSDVPVNLIGFSMGGLVIREAIRQDPNLPTRNFVFLNSPHNGSLSGHLLPLAACRDMRPGSKFLRRLSASPWNHPTLISWCPWDLMVLPGHSARWDAATRSLRSDFPAHNWPVYSPGIQSAVVRFLIDHEN